MIVSQNFPFARVLHEARSTFLFASVYARYIQVREHVVSTQDNVGSATGVGRTTSSEDNSPVLAVPSTLQGETTATTSVVGQGRQSLASIGSESSFFRTDDAACDDEHRLCSTPSRCDALDDQLTQQLSTPPSDWIVTPATLDFSAVSPPPTNDDHRGQRSPPVTSALAGRRYGCVQMPQLTPITEADDELDDIDNHHAAAAAAAAADDDDDDGDVFIAADNQWLDDFSSHQAQHHTLTSDILDLTAVTPITSLDLTSLSVASSTPSADKIRHLQTAAETVGAIRLDADDSTQNETTSEKQEEHGRMSRLSSYSSIYSNYVCDADDVTRGASPGNAEWNDVVVDYRDSAAQSAVSALGQRGGVGLGYRQSYLNRTPVDVDDIQLAADKLHRGRRRHYHHLQQQQQQLSVLRHHEDSLEDHDEITADPTDGTIRRRASMYHENLI